MADTRKTRKSLTGTRIYVTRGKYRYESPFPILNSKTGKLQKGHYLCSVADGEFKAREALHSLLNLTTPPKGNGDFSAWIEQWKSELLEDRKLKKPNDPARIKTWQKGSNNITSALNVIADKFADFDVVQVEGFDVAQFLDRWKGRRSAQTYRSYLIEFFKWCISRHGLIKVNPASEISVKPPKKRDVYMTDDQFNKIREALPIGADGLPIRNGEMIQCYMDLLYLLFQRGTDVRLMRWDEIKSEGILIEPTKTENSSGLKVLIPMGDDLRSVLAKIKSISKMRSTFVIHTEHGQPYTASGVRSAFMRAAERAGVKGVTLKDIRPKAATDAKKQGYSVEQIQVALAHTEESSTLGYLRDQPAPVSEVILKLPKRKKLNHLLQT